MHLSIVIVNEYAEQVAQNLGGKYFPASLDWWEKVRKINGIVKSVKLHGESGEVDHEQIKKKILEIQTLLENYILEQICNWDKTGLYFQSIPNATYTAPNEVRKCTRGTKALKAKDCVTLLTCTNVTGTHQIPVAMIDKAEKPHCFKAKPCPLPYKTKKNAYTYRWQLNSKCVMAAAD